MASHEANTPARSVPSEVDVLFGRACLAFQLVGRDQLLACVADQRRLAQEGRPFTLAQVMIGRRVITADTYRQVAQRVQAHLAQQGRQQALEQAPPDITATGRYHNVREALLREQAERQRLPQGVTTDRIPVAQPSAQNVQWSQLPAQHSPEEIAAAERTWDSISSVVEDPGYDVIAEPVTPAPQARPQSARFSGSETGPPVPPPGPGALGRERKDTGIRRLLGVPDSATEFDFGPYRVLGEIAAGGMGVIYRARSSDTGRVYALKALINVENANEKQLRRFIQEAQSAMRLDHPGIVKIHDIGIFENIPYFTMDLVEGHDLQHHIKQRSFPREQLLEIVAKTCHAVHYAHEKAVIHRDLKPANIIVREPDRYPILTDFGLAKNLDSSFKLTAEGAMVGTPLFLSPEQVAGKGHAVDRRCDVYGLGVMLYQILAGKLPFVGRNPYEVYRKVLEEDPKPPREHDPTVPEPIERVCLMALAKDREERYPTALAMAEDIERSLRGEPVQAKLPTPVGGPAGSTARQGRPRAGGASAPAGAGPPPWMLLAIAGLALVIVLGLAAIVYLLATG